MKISIQKPLFFTELGKRDNNEDCIYPFPTQLPNENNKLFVVCDGVGGQDKGEFASELACKTFEDFFEKIGNKNVTDDTIKQSFAVVENAFDNFFEKNPSSKGMATTVVMAYLHEGGVSVGYCGDSRLYQIRNKQIIFQTQDHTPTNDLLRAGIITLEEAQENKRTSKISRAMQGKSVRAVLPEIIHITDIQKDDIFFLCSDGVWDTLDDNFIKLFQSDSSDKDLIKMIIEYCSEDSKDNFSAYLIRIEEVVAENRQSIQPPPKTQEIPKIQKTIIQNSLTQANQTPLKKNNLVQNIAITSIILAIPIIAYIIYTNNNSPVSTTSNHTKEKQEATTNSITSETNKNIPQNNNTNTFNKKNEEPDNQNEDNTKGKSEKTIIKEFYEKTTKEDVSVSLVTGNLYRITKQGETISSLCLYNGKKPQNVGGPYQSEWKFGNGLCKISTNDIPAEQKHGFINTNGTPIGDGVVYESIKLENGKIHAVKNGEDVYMDLTGKKITENKPTEKSEKQPKKETEKTEEKPNEKSE